MTVPTTFLGFHIAHDGYGYSTICIARELQKLNPSIAIVDMCEEAGKHGQPGARTWRIPGAAIVMATPQWLPYIEADMVILSTMFEATKLPPNFVDFINIYAGRMIVPCEWNIAVFRANGVMAPMNVVKLGIDPHDYYPLERQRAASAPYTFLWSGTPDRRKGWDVAYRAFWQAFKGDPCARLILHFREMPRALNGCDDANVEIVSGSLSLARLRDLLQRADCYVFPSRGEGWGLPPREAAATGLPVIATNWGGLAEEIDNWALPIGVKGMSKAEYGWDDWQDIGQWAEPDLDQLVERMRWCFENQRSAAHFGCDAATWLAKYATYERTAHALLEIVKEGG